MNETRCGVKKSDVKWEKGRKMGGTLEALMEWLIFDLHLTSFKTVSNRNHKSCNLIDGFEDKSSKVYCSFYLMLSLIRPKTRKKRTIIFGLESDNGSRDIVLRLLTKIANPGDYILASHVQEPNDSFNPNTFHIHEDVCKSKQVDLQVKVCETNSFISNVTRHVRENFATILVLGCSLSRPDYSVFSTCLKGLPPTCTLMVMDNLGRTLLQKQGTCQQGSESAFLRSSHSSVSKSAAEDHQTNTCLQRKCLTLPSLHLPSRRSTEKQEISLANKKGQAFPKFAPCQLFPSPGLALQDSTEIETQFTSKQLNRATNKIDPALVIGEGGHSKVYRPDLETGQAAAVKVELD